MSSLDNKIDRRHKNEQNRREQTQQELRKPLCATCCYTNFHSMRKFALRPLYGLMITCKLYAVLRLMPGEE